MVCKKCNCEAAIQRARIEVQGDDSPDAQTTVCRVLDFVCRNSKCANFEKKVEEKRVEIYGGQQEGV